jgi:hypothetical protein
VKLKILISRVIIFLLLIVNGIAELGMSGSYIQAASFFCLAWLFIKG